MKKVLFITIVTSLLLAVGLAFGSCETQEYINVYNWGLYISDGSDGTIDVNEAFTEATGIKVNYSYFTSNEDMYAKVKGGGSSYDVIFPSEYMAQRMLEEGMLLELDYSNIPNASNISEAYRGMFFDPDDKYTVPYNVGLVGLIYNKTMVEEAPTSWSVLWDERYAGKILMINNPRDGFGIAQLMLGIDLNTTDKADWDRALQALAQQKPLVQSYVMDEVFMKMESGEAALAVYYAGDFLTMKENNPDLEMVFPTEGTNRFVDVMCIPKTAQNKSGAEKYINFLLSSEIALANAEYLYYTSPNKAVLENPDYSLKDDPYTYPSEEVMENTQYYHNLDEDTLKYMNDLWDTLKIDGGESNGTAIVIALVAVAAAAGLIVFLRIRKKKREAMM
jgi:spermidine/putrescine transport system substrate-binding protein